jgi:hypothetical protein
VEVFVVVMKRNSSQVVDVVRGKNNGTLWWCCRVVGKHIVVRVEGEGAVSVKVIRPQT